MWYTVTIFVPVSLLSPPTSAEPLPLPNESPFYFFFLFLLLGPTESNAGYLREHKWGIFHRHVGNLPVSSPMRAKSPNPSVSTHSSRSGGPCESLLIQEKMLVAPSCSGLVEVTTSAEFISVTAVWCPEDILQHLLPSSSSYALSASLPTVFLEFWGG